MNIIAVVPRSHLYDAEVWERTKRVILRAKWTLSAIYCLITLLLMLGQFSAPLRGQPFSLTKLLLCLLLLPAMGSYALLAIWLRPKIFTYLSVDESGVFRPGVRLLGLWFWRPTHCEVIKDSQLPQFSRLVVFHKEKMLCSLPIDDLAKAAAVVEAFNTARLRESNRLQPLAT